MTPLGDEHREAVHHVRWAAFRMSSGIVSPASHEPAPQENPSAGGPTGRELREPRNSSCRDDAAQESRESAVAAIVGPQLSRRIETGPRVVARADDGSYVMVTVSTVLGPVSPRSARPRRRTTTRGGEDRRTIRPHGVARVPT